MPYKYTIDELRLACQNAISIRQALKTLNLKPCGGNYASFKNQTQKHNISTAHFLSQGWNKGQYFGPKRLTEEYLANKHSILSHRLRKRLIKEGLFQLKCDSCHLESWLLKPIPLELHHKDGNRLNNNLSNLEQLCPNCHALTPNYRGKNKKS